YEGYGDTRLATLIALRRRGFKPETIVNLMVDVGVKPVDVTISWENLYAINRKIVDKEANRYFFVSNPILLEVSGLSLSEEREFKIRLHLHPDNPERGFRELKVDVHDEKTRLYVSKEDLSLLQPGKVVRLMGFINIKIEEVKDDVVKASFHSKGYEEVKKLKTPLIHYLPVEGNHPAKVMMPNGLKVAGLVEPAVKNVKVGEVVQFERFGFARVERVDDEFLAIFTHR
ncbi:MAG: glutamate--tRNA ligase, partial [Candidatus Bathyarchaeota archaeon]|nr:glutamate--tRNA ligase [Candidatus Bathyarchaeota archaeon]